jgi:hypothetical protein
MEEIMIFKNIGYGIKFRVFPIRKDSPVYMKVPTFKFGGSKVRAIRIKDGFRIDIHDYTDIKSRLD